LHRLGGVGFDSRPVCWLASYCYTTMPRTTYTIRHDGVTVQTTSAQTAECESKHGATVTAVTHA